MDEERFPGGYGGSSASSGNPNFGSDFISFGQDTSSDGSHKQWRPRGGHRGRPQMISGSGNYRPFQSGPPRGGWNNRGPNQPFYQRRGGGGFDHSRGGGGGYDHHRGRGGGFDHHRGGGGRGYDHHRGNRNQRHQGQRSSNSSEDISSYFHPSMMEDPWLELERVMKVPQSSDSSKTVQTVKDENSENSDHSVDSNDS